MNPINIQTLAELVAFALIAERRAHERYSADAHNMELSGHTDLAAVFRRLADEERRHVDELKGFVAGSGLEIDLERAAQRFAEAARSGGPEADRRAPDGATPYGALARAVTNEERAFEFYCQVAASATDPQMRAYAQAFAQEELAHAALLRAQRREAYHRERLRTGDELPPAERIVSCEDLLRIALALERRLAARVEPGPLADACEALITTLAAALGPVQPAPARGPAPPARCDAIDSQAALRDELDQLFSFYDRVAQTTQDEAVARRAQSLMAETLSRIQIVGRTEP